MTAGSALLPVLGSPALAAPSAGSVTGLARNLPLNEDWRFYRGEGQFEAAALDDRVWRQVHLPHDWSVEDIPGGQAPDQLGPFDRHAIGRNPTGFTVGGEGWYRKHFRVDSFPSDARVEIVFEGSYLETDVWLNGSPVGRSVYGYAPFVLDLTPKLDRGGNNVLAVRVRNLGRNTRWYAGSGLYRPVSLDILPAGTRLARWGVGAWTRRIADGAADVDVSTAIIAPSEGVKLVTRLVDTKGTVVCEAESPAADQVSQSLRLLRPHLWSLDNPALYTLRSELRRNGVVIDRVDQPFGVRIVAFDPRQGMSLNGVPVKLRGGCVHHDNGLLGARAFADADERRVRLLKARGFSAIRSSHNPSSNSLREACDRLGMFLIEEAFDVWHERKEPDDFAGHFRENWQAVIEAMVLPARNSPSVIMWSIGNEIPSRSTDEGVKWAWTLANAVKRLDRTRPVTAGLNGVLGAEMTAGVGTARPGMADRHDNASTIFLDIPGYNYRLEEVQSEFSTHPERVVYASETFPKNMFDYAELTRSQPRFLGEFVWTAMDYIGEAGVGANARLKQGSPPYYLAGWPWVNAWCGDLDLLGFQKAQSLARDVVWGVQLLAMTVQRPVPEGMFEWVSSWGWSDELESWTWPGSEGQPLAVRIYTSADRVELLLNGKKVGEKLVTAADRMHLEFKVPYAPGHLEAVAIVGGREVARCRLTTAGPATQLALTPEQRSVRRGRDRLAFVPIEVRDAQGRLLPDDSRAIDLTITGPAEVVALGSANPLATGSLSSGTTQTFRGRAMAILRGTGKSGLVKVRATSAGLAAAVASIRMA